MKKNRQVTIMEPAKYLMPHSSILYSRHKLQLINFIKLPNLYQNPLPLLFQGNRNTQEIADKSDISCRNKIQTEKERDLGLIFLIIW